MIEFILALILFGAAGAAMYDLPFWRMALAILLVQGGQILIRSSGML